MLSYLVLLLALFLWPGVYAASSINFENRTLFSENAAYCSPPGSILLSGLDLRYDGNKKELSFSVGVSSNDNDNKLDVSLTLYVYGENFVEMNVNLCSIMDGAICPIPSYNFTGSGSMIVPKDFSDNVPEIAFIVPDIEALAVLKLTEQDTGKPMGCMQLSLFNSRTVLLSEITWSTGAFAIAATVASAVTTIWTDSLSALQWRVVDVVTTMQTIAWVSMLTNIMPRVVHAFSKCLAWAVGLVKIEPVQSSIDATRHSTDSDDVQLMFGALLEAQYSRLANYYPAEVINTNRSAKLGTLNGFPELDRSLRKRKLYAPNTGPGGEMDPGSTRSNVVWALPIVPFSQAGAFFYLEALPISPYGAFLTVAVSWLLVMAVLLACSFLLLPFCIARYGAPLPQAVEHGYVQCLRPMLLRLLECASPPLVTFALFQFVNSNGWVSHLGAALFCVALAAIWVIVWLQQWVQVRQEGPRSLYYKRTSPYRGDSAAIHIGSPSHPYRPRYWWFWAVILLCAFLRACFVAIPQKADYGLRQSIGLLVVDLLLLVVLIACRPACDKKGNMVMIVLTIFRLLAWILCLVLTTNINIWGIPRAVLGLVLLAVLALAILFIFLVFLWDICTALVSSRQRWTKRYAPALSDEKTDKDSPANKDVSSEEATTTP
ncbi:hypothetical protein MNAN1_001362 [Malassezia nana]|uniref:ML-like domain-containing protein n=1 Tax=Malassezia nana TaxID=180528 RepID=A0AAF0EH71_9BASI|nr:hypothetical protein MNAN1_001362 [Malassezia nana]